MESTLSRTYLLLVGFRPQERLNLQLAIPYKDITSPKTLGGDSQKYFKRHFSGLADTVVLATYDVQRSRDGKNVLAIVGGLRLPTGRANPDHDWIATDGSTISSRDPVLQTGHGTYDPILGIRFDGSTPGGSVFAVLLHRFSGGKNGYDYTFGSETQLTAGGYQSLGKNWTAGLTAHLLHETYDNDWKKSGRVANTGGTWLNLVPSIAYQMANGPEISLSASLPIYRKTNGNILNAPYTITISVTWTADTRHRKKGEG